MKKIISAVLVSIATIALAAGCSQTKGEFNAQKEISVISREDGSGTRGAFVELFGIEIKGDGFRKDLTTKEAVVANKTDVMMSNIANDAYAIGYISIGSINDTIKVLNINGFAPSAENIKNNTYTIARPFNIATIGELDMLTEDFINFILSADGQEVVESNGCVSVDGAKMPYSGSKPEGKITIAGSSSVTPVMEKLKEAYCKINTNAVIEIHQSDSTSGITGVLEGIYDIGMASRDFTQAELQSINPVVIGIDGIAIIINNRNPLTNMTSEQVRGIFTGEYTTWDEITQ